jgi:hypothetical protein
VYIPPVNSSFGKDFTINIWENLAEAVEQFALKGNIILCGDFNARTAEGKDFIEMDNENNVYELPSNYSFDTLHGRKSMDHLTQKPGKRLLKMCIENDLSILNGRTLGDLEGHFTCHNQKGSSVVDYFICSNSLRRNILGMKVHPLTMYSDHCQLEISILIEGIHTSKNIETSKRLEESTSSDRNQTKYVWDEFSKEKFKRALSMPWIQKQIAEIDEQLNKSFTNEREISLLADTFKNVISSAANISLTRKTTKHKKKKRKRNNKKWFDTHCQKQRNELKSLLNAFNRQPYNKTLQAKLFNQKKIYKQIVKQKKSQYKRLLVEELNSALNKDPQTIWNTLKDIQTLGENVQQRHQINICKWITHLENLIGKKSVINEEHERNVKFELEKEKTKNDYKTLPINLPMTEKEIRHACINQKNNKSPGLDGITNEMIKTSLPVVQTVLVKLFNAIFTSGFYPEAWKHGINIPLYKNGNPTDPNNYRGITLTNTLGKVFCSVLNTRINNYLEGNDLLLKEQGGFRKKYRTTDQIFILNNIISEVMKSRNNRLYACFVDFQKAFDSVWHEGLFIKLQRIGITGHCFDVINNMYTNAKICAKIDGIISKDFVIQRGVHQGSSLSPTLFNVFINDITENMTDIDSPIIDRTKNKKISCLLYADDLILLSTTKNGLQQKLDHLDNYCKQWGLNINKQKTKVVIFTKSDPKVSIHFFCGEDSIQTVEEYKYLGIIFHKNAGIKNTEDHLNKQANKAMHTLTKTLRKTNTDMRIVFQLYDALITPVSIYGAEVWFPNSLQANKLENIEDILKKCVHSFFHEKLHSKFCRYTLGVHKKTMVLPVLSECGRFPISIKVICQVIAYWIHILDLPNNANIRTVYNGLYAKSNNSSTWVSFAENILTSTGLNHVWKNQSTLNINKLKFAISKKLEKVYLKLWRDDISKSSRLHFYNKYTTDYKVQTYLNEIKTFKHRQALSKLRLSAHDLKIEKGRYTNTPREKRLCEECNVIEDEIHLLDKCVKYNNFRHTLLDNVKTKNIYPSNLLLCEKLHPYLAKYVHDCFTIR